ncbi:MAG: hypothetical protein DMF29_11585 [Verrucomicrobia bacterium]|nr:MAG: hypothetical protein DMF29_11585 [Verrucomicrobiota bacterium]
MIPALFEVVVRQKLMRRRSNPDSEPNIRRIDTKARAKKQTHGFQVHLLRGKNAVTRMFSDSLHGGKEGARRAARKFKRTAMGRAGKRGVRSMSRRRRRR